MMMKGEIKSNIKKLWRHLPYILNMTEITKPISLSLHLTNKCNLNCEFCYIKNIDKTKELDYTKLIKFIQVNQPKSVLLTGGEPCLYPDINNLIIHLIKRKIKIGMFTNGLYLKNIMSCLQYFSWLRVSINHYIDNKIKFKDPEYPKKLSYNYIKHKDSPLRLKKKLIKFMDKHRGLYLRVVPDVFGSPYLINMNQMIDNFMFYPESKTIIQKAQSLKHYKGKCYMGYLKPYLNADGLVYPCINTVDPKTKIRDKTKSIINIDHPYELLEFKDIIMNCKNCGLWEKNEFIKYINEKKIEDEDFL